MKKHSFLSAIAVSALLPIFIVRGWHTVRVQASEQPTATEIMEGMDRVRNPGQPYRVVLALTEYVNGKPRDSDGLVLYVKQDQQSRQFNNLVRYAEPPRDAGKIVLYRGNNLWFYDPASKASIRISPQQRLIGQASEGDVLTVNLARDYSAKLAGEGTQQDADRKDRDCYHLN